MKSRLKLFTCLTILFCSCGQNGQLPSDKVSKTVVPIRSIKVEESQKTVDTIAAYHIYEEHLYPDASGKNIIFLNSFPKGGGQIEPGGLIGYYDWQGTHYGHVVFWTRFTNERSTPLELNINFPADAMTLPDLQQPSFRLFLPPDTLTLNQLPLYNYGLTGITDHIDSTFHQSAQLQKTILPNESYMFYVSMLVRDTEGSIRNGFILKEQDLFYKVKFTRFGSTLLPCGSINFKKN